MSKIPKFLYGRAYGIVQAITKLIVILLALAGNARAQGPIGPADRATIKGIVLDARTEVPLSKVLVTVEGGGLHRETFVRASVSGTSASLTGEGPLGHGKRGSWARIRPQELPGCSV